MHHVKDAQHRVLYRDEHAYCAHPCIVSLSNERWLVVFNKSVRRQGILHPPHDPRYYNMIIRSEDGGRTWCTPRVAPGYDWYGVECAGLTVLDDGTLLLNQWRFKWYPLEAAYQLQGTGVTTADDWFAEVQHGGENESYYGPSARPKNPAEMAPWGRANDGAYVHRSLDGGLTWDETVQVATRPYSGGYGMRGGAQLPNGDVLLPLSDVPSYRTVFVVRSKDGGRSWEAPVEAASQPGRWFEEPSALVLEGNTVLMVMRENETGYLHRCVSRDGGQTWSEPEPTPIRGYPAHLLALPDRRILCVYGYRFDPYQIRAVVSEDRGQSWDIEHGWVVRDNLVSADLGYPSSVLMDDGQVFTVYYAQDEEGVTSIQATSYHL